ncbi:MAG: CsgG/HfaB family protein [candidate division WOR-3 bacterium]
MTIIKERSQLVLKKISLLIIFLMLGCGTALRSIQQEYSDSAFSPNFDQTKIYRLVLLPVNATGIRLNPSEANALYDFIALELLKTNRFSLVERNRIEDILKEQEFGVSGIVDASTAAKIGKVLGADAVMLTEVTELKKDEFFQNENAYDAKVFVRIIDATTAEILFYGKGRGESMQGRVNATEMAFTNAIKTLQGGIR